MTGKVVEVVYRSVNGKNIRLITVRVPKPWEGNPYQEYTFCTDEEPSPVLDDEVRIEFIT